MTELPLTPFLLYGAIGGIMLGMGLYALVIHTHVFRKILAWNALGSGIFLIIGAIGKRNATGVASDPLPQAVVITGIVVSVSATALALAIALRLYGLTKDSSLEPSVLDRRAADDDKAKERSC